MKVFILTLLVLNSLCFALGGEEEKNDFIDLDADEGEVPLSDDSVEDEEQAYSDDLEDDDEDPQEDEGDDEPEDPNAFKDDSVDSVDDPNSTEEKLKGSNSVDAILEPTPFTPTPSGEPGSGTEPQEDADLKDKLGLK